MLSPPENEIYYGTIVDALRVLTKSLAPITHLQVRGLLQRSKDIFFESCRLFPALEKLVVQFDFEYSLHALPLSPGVDGRIEIHTATMANHAAMKPLLRTLTDVADAFFAGRYGDVSGSGLEHSWAISQASSLIQGALFSHFHPQNTCLLPDSSTVMSDFGRDSMLVELWGAGMDIDTEPHESIPVNQEDTSHQNSLAVVSRVGLPTTNFFVSISFPTARKAVPDIRCP